MCHFFGAREFNTPSFYATDGALSDRAVRPDAFANRFFTLGALLEILFPPREEREHLDIQLDDFEEQFGPSFFRVLETYGRPADDSSGTGPSPSQLPVAKAHAPPPLPTLRPARPRSCR